MYEFTKSGPHTTNPNDLIMTDCLEMLYLAGYKGPQNENFGVIAYALSKMTIVDEMEDYGNY